MNQLPEFPEGSEQDLLENDYEQGAIDAGDGSMDEEQLRHIIGAMTRDAENFVMQSVKILRQEAQKRYDGDPYGDEVEGRSQVMSRDVRDSVASILPSLMRVFFGSERVVEYAPAGPEDEATADQATDYINLIIQKDNPGFREFYTAFKDALVLKTGVIKWWWDTSTKVEATRFSGIDEASLTALMSQEGIEIADLESYPFSLDQPADGAAGPNGEPLPPDQQPPQPMLFDGIIKRKYEVKRAKIRALAPEELLIDSRASSIEDAEIVIHRSYPTISELVAMGYEEDDLQLQSDDAYVVDIERQTRTKQVGTFENSSNPALKRVRYDECYVRIDFDKDGIAELRRICTIGNTSVILHNEPCDEAPFAVFCPDPKPHMFFGNSVTDVTADIQRIKTVVMREMLNSLAQSITPRMGVVEGQVNIEDALNNENGGIIRMKAPGMVMPYETPFVGQAAFPVLQYLDDIKEQRTGRSKASQGLEGSALQSTTKAAVDATVSAAQEATELIARIFAESGMKQLFSGLLRLVIKHQDKPRVVRLRNKWVNIDPRSWDAGMDVNINVALGGGTTEDRMVKLQSIAQKQEQILQTAGMDNPIVSISQYANTLRKMAEISGFPDSSRFFTAVPQDFKMPAPQKPDQQPGPEQMLAQVQAQAIQADIQKKSAELQLQREKMLRDDDRARDQMVQDMQIRLKELELKYNANLQSTAMKIEAQQQMNLQGMNQQ